MHSNDYAPANDFDDDVDVDTNPTKDGIVEGVVDQIFRQSNINPIDS